MKRIALLLGLFSALPLTAQTYDWSKTSFPGNTISGMMGRLVPHPTDPNTVFLGTIGDIDPMAGTTPPGDGLWVSHDAGLTWSVVTDAVFLATFNVADFTICKSDPNVMYAATAEFGVFKSLDGGLSWAAANGGLPFPNADYSAVAIAVDPNNPNQVYVSVAQTGGLDIFNLSPSHPGFFVSTDGGTSWMANHSGLPPRSDGLGDSKSHTAVAASILVLPQAPNYVLLGMLDLSVNTVLLFGSKTATSKGRVFYSDNRAAGSFTEIGNGLPTGISQGTSLGTSVARISSSTMLLTSSNGPVIDIWATHTGLTFDVDLVGNSLVVNRGKGAFFTQNGAWSARNNGLPTVSSWTDPASDATTTIKYIDSTSVGSPAVGTGTMNGAVLIGSLRSDQGSAASNATKVHGSLSSGSPAWARVWGDTGLDTSPTLGLTEANASGIVFNCDMTWAFATVTWTDATNAAPAGDDDGVYRVYLR